MLWSQAWCCHPRLLRVPLAVSTAQMPCVLAMPWLSPPWLPGTCLACMLSRWANWWQTAWRSGGRQVRGCILHSCNPRADFICPLPCCCVCTKGCLCEQHTCTRRAGGVQVGCPCFLCFDPPPPSSTRSCAFWRNLSRMVTFVGLQTCCCQSWHYCVSCVYLHYHTAAPGARSQRQGRALPTMLTTSSVSLFDLFYLPPAGSLGGAERAAAIAAAAAQGLPAPLRPTKELYQEKSLNLTGVGTRVLPATCLQPVFLAVHLVCTAPGQYKCTSGRHQT